MQTYPQMLKLIRWWFCLHRRRSSKKTNEQTNYPGYLEQISSANVCISESSNSSLIPRGNGSEDMTWTTPTNR